MTFRSTMLHLTLLAVLASGCSAVPEVESRLRSIQFPSNLYVVRAGDTLESVAFRYAFDTDELAMLNPTLPREGLLPRGARVNVRSDTRVDRALAERGAPSRVTPESVAGRNATSRPVTAYDAPDVLAAIPYPVPRRSVEPALPPARGDEPLLRAEPYREPLMASTGGRERVVQPLPDSSHPLDGRPVVVEPARGAAREPERDVALAMIGGGEDHPREEVLPGDYDVADAISSVNPAAASAYRSAATLEGELQRHAGRWEWPLEGIIARDFAPEKIGGQGVDIAGVPGQSVRAAFDGTVVYSGRDLSGEGQLVILRHEDDLLSTYSHADELYVDEQQQVLAGDVIANLGWNERSESVLGFEVRRDGNPLDPMAFLAR